MIPNLYAVVNSRTQNEKTIDNNRLIELIVSFFIQLFGQELQLDWIIFHDVLVTSRVYVRTLCPIRYEWVKDLLPKLHEIDVYELSSVAREEVTDEEMAQWEKKEAAKRQAGVFEYSDLQFDCCQIVFFGLVTRVLMFKQSPVMMQRRSWKRETMKARSMRLVQDTYSENRTGHKVKTPERE